MGMDPEWEQADCNGTTGNLVIRELSIDDAVAISLPEGREAGCFTLEVDGADIDDLDFEIQIVEETDPPSDPAPTMWHSDDGKEQRRPPKVGAALCCPIRFWQRNTPALYLYSYSSALSDVK